MRVVELLIVFTLLTFVNGKEGHSHLNSRFTRALSRNDILENEGKGGDGANGGHGGQGGSGTDRSNNSYRFHTRLPFFGSSMMKPYENCGELRQDITAALEHIFDNTIDYELATSCCRDDGDCGGGSGSGNGFDLGGPGGGGGGGCGDRDDLPIQQFGGVGGKNVGHSDSGGFVASGMRGENSFDTKNQTQSVEDIDVVKSDGTYIFAAYGREVVMTNLLGDNMDRVDSLGTVTGLLLHAESKTITAVVKHKETGVRTRVYSYTSGSLKIAQSVNIVGTYVDARSIGSNTFIISSVPVPELRHRQRCSSLFTDFNDTAFEEASFKMAQKTIPLHVKKILNSIGISRNKGDNACGNIARITTTTSVDADSTERVEDRILESMRGRRLLRKFILFTSFDSSQHQRSLDIKLAGAFLPTSRPQLYFDNKFIVAAVSGYKRTTAGLNKPNVFEPQAFLTSFEFQNDNSEIVPNAVGQAKGLPFKKGSIDFFEATLRIATASFSRWEYVGGRWRLVSSKTLLVSKLEFRGNGEIKLIGQLENIPAKGPDFEVRFYRNRGYVFSFHGNFADSRSRILIEKQPLVPIIDMGTETPTVQGNLVVPEHSNILQPIGNNDQFLLGIANDKLKVFLQVFLLDVSDPTNPREVQSYTVQYPVTTESQFDIRVFRYLPKSKKLILPIGSAITSCNIRRNFFDGFIVIDVDAESGIDPAGMIAHANQYTIERNLCYNNAVMTTRSLVVDGNIVSFKGHSIKYSSGANEVTTGWEWNLDKQRKKQKKRCFSY